MTCSRKWNIFLITIHTNCIHLLGMLDVNDDAINQQSDLLNFTSIDLSTKIYSIIPNPLKFCGLFWALPVFQVEIPTIKKSKQSNVLYYT